MNSGTAEVIHRKAAFLWVAVITIVLLLVPLIAMQFTEEVNWGVTDFIVMSFLLASMGSVFVLVSRRVLPRRRIVLGAVMAALLLYLWAELAVGVFTDLGS